MAITNERQLNFYNRLKLKYDADERNLKNNPDKCGGENHIKGYMSGLMEGMSLMNPDNKSICMKK